MEPGEAFRVQEGLARGLSQAHLRGRAFAHPHWGIRSASAPKTALESALAFAPRMPARAFFFGTTAALLWGLPLPPRLAGSELHIAVSAGARRIDATGVRPHHVTVAAADRTIHLGVAVTTVERTWCDLAASGLTLAELVAAGDFAIRHRKPLTTRQGLARAATRHPGRRGVRIRRRALELLSERSDSPPESEIRVAIIEAGLPIPSVNIPAVDARGRFLAQPDLSWPRLRLALEYEGDHHRTDRRQWQTDLERFANMQEHGWTVLRATAADYRDSRRLLARLSRIIRGREST